MVDRADRELPQDKYRFMDPYNILIATGAVVSGLASLVWSADRFVDGAAALARIIDMSPLLIGMLVVGFGTSAPEMMVSAFALRGLG